ncbi:helix-turn-helix domain-containing protein [Leifsonia aquatica]|uniref:helix-turn-helix domain-containing protein n=1 Tax=Leifsonia aquatica TaxID=144185 RepID=UPI0038125655
MAPRPQSARATPRRGSSDWPNEVMADYRQEVARRLSLNILDALGGRSTRSIALEVGIDPNTLTRIINGEIWCDINTLAKLERELGTLWPGRLGPTEGPPTP